MYIEIFFRIFAFSRSRGLLEFCHFFDLCRRSPCPGGRGTVGGCFFMATPGMAKKGVQLCAVQSHPECRENGDKKSEVCTVILTGQKVGTKVGF